MGRRLTFIGFGSVFVLMIAAGAYDGYLNRFYTQSGAVWWALRSIGAIIGLWLLGDVLSRVIDWVRPRRAR